MTTHKTNGYTIPNPDSETLGSITHHLDVLASELTSRTYSDQLPDLINKVQVLQSQVSNLYGVLQTLLGDQATVVSSASQAPSHSIPEGGGLTTDSKNDVLGAEGYLSNIYGSLQKILGPMTGAGGFSQTQTPEKVKMPAGHLGLQWSNRGPFMVGDLNLIATLPDHNDQSKSILPVTARGLENCDLLVIR